MRTPLQLLFAFTALIGAAGLNASLRAQTQAPGQPPPRLEETVDVVGTTPLHGLGIDRDKVPGNVQTIVADPAAAGGTSVAEQLERGATSVHVNETTTNPFQPDLQFRGFVGSPLLGLPQGLAVYQNGVRLNEVFGDTVNWDLLPSNAVAGIELMPGSNPLFGLNALGGALSVQTKSGFSHPGHAGRVSAGSFGRYVVEAESGGGSDRVSYFIAGSVLGEDGWRQHSPSRVRQLFGDVEWRRPSTTVNATVTTAFNRLIGNGPAPVQLLDEDRDALFTYPDETKTGMTLLSVRARHSATPVLAVDAMAYYRRANIRTFNGDDSNYDECEDEDLEEFLCADDGEGELVFDQFGDLIEIPPGVEFDATNNTSRTVSNGWGGALQATRVAPLRGRANHFVAGVTIDGGRSRYSADTEIAQLNDDRGTFGSGLLDEDAAVRLQTTVLHTGAYVADFFSPVPRLTLMGAARFNHSVITLRDQLGTDLDGDHRFSRLNPAAGATVAIHPAATVYGGFSMSSRVPAPSELSCADPDDPCRLPNAFVADPPLEQVVAHTWEGGVRGRRDDWSWNASLFRTQNRDDIMFISSGPLTNTGHFENVGDTVRQGVELGAAGDAGALRWGAGYTYLRARFDTPLTLSSPNHPDEVDGEIEVEPGDHLPGIPQHSLKFALSTAIGRLGVGGTLVRASSQYLRGDEANLLPALDGFTTVNLQATVTITRHLSLQARVANLFDSDHATFGLLGEPDEVLGDDYDDPRFVSPSAPRAAWIGLEYSFK